MAYDLLLIGIQVAAAVVADAAPSLNVTGIGGIITGLSGTGFAVWYAYHTTTKTIPDLNSMHAATIKELTVAFAATVEKVQKDAREETRIDRHLYRNESHARHLEIQALTIAVEELVEKLGHPGALQIKSPKVEITKAPDSDPDIDAVK